MSGREPNNCQDRRHDDLAAYALGALPEPEAEELERHLAECPACTERLVWLQPAVDLVPASVQQLEPPPELKSTLMAIVREEAAEADTEHARAGAEVAAVTGASASARSGRRSWFRMPQLRLAPIRPAIAGLAVLAVMIAGVGGYIAGNGGSDAGAETFAVKPVSPKFTASGTVEVSGDRGTLVLDKLPPLPVSEVYQVWTVQGDRVQPSSIFVAEKDGKATTSIPDIPSGTDQVLITREPAGGSEQATTAPFLAATLD